MTALMIFIYLFIGALIDRACSDGRDPEFVTFMFWPIVIIFWLAGETVKLFKYIFIRKRIK